jgi:hypothetical protein
MEEFTLNTAHIYILLNSMSTEHSLTNNRKRIFVSYGMN